MNNIFGIIIMLFVFFILFIIQIMMPKLTRKDVFFGIRIPKENINNPLLEQITKSYRKQISFTLIPYILVMSLIVIYGFNEVIYIIGVFGMIGISTLIYYINHKKVEKIKKENNWGENKKQILVVNTSTTNGKYNKNSVSALWFIIPVVIVLVNIYLGYKQYDIMPQRIPVRWDLQGQITGWQTKSFGSVFGLPLIQVFVTGLLFFVYKSMGWAKKQISVVNPEESLEKNRLFRLAWSGYIVFLSILINIMFTVSYLSVIQVININSGLLAITSIILPIFMIVPAIVIAIKIGQGGSRIDLKAKKTEESNLIDKDDDKFWKLGLFYVNKNDPSIFIEKRFGVGFTLNFGRIESYFVICGIVAFVLIMVFIPKLI